MNARGEIVEGVARPPRRSDYEPIVKGLRPFIEGEELELRASLLLMRDMAVSTKPSACEPAWYLLDIVERQASEAALNHRYKLDDLRQLRYLCLKCVATASDFDMLYQPRLPGIDKGEANARG